MLWLTAEWCIRHCQFESKMSDTPLHYLVAPITLFISTPPCQLISRCVNTCMCFCMSLDYIVISGLQYMSELDFSIGQLQSSHHPSNMHADLQESPPRTALNVVPVLVNLYKLKALTEIRFVLLVSPPLKQGHC